ncbi:hypothetical protein PoB_001819700 [Plakobranchus ocellatus]|uniref:Uncharacterized protein n=1 Tax=Plakobranchus ocellatus TaxID=259542 RepID=A0AAV3ZB25_9GAST|nr:hypothetical protein PoB_001819700 [Plakobranchus ocellatus]
MILTPRSRMNGKSRKINSTCSNPIGTSCEQSTPCCWKESADDAFLTEVFLKRYGFKSTEQVLNVEPAFTRKKQVEKMSGHPAEFPLSNGTLGKSGYSKNNGHKERFRTRSQQMVREAWVSAENKHSVNNSNAHSLIQCQQSSAYTAKQPENSHKGFTNLKVSDNKQENSNRNEVSNYKLYTRDLSRSINIPHDSAATRRIGFAGVSRSHIMDDINTNRGRADHQQLMTNLRQSTDMYRPYRDTAVTRLCSHHLVSDKYQPILSHQSRPFSGENCWTKRTSLWRNTVPFSPYSRLEAFDTASHFPYTRSKSCDFPRRSGLLLYPAVNKFTPASRRSRPGVYRNSRRINKILNDINFEGRKHVLYNEKALGSFNDQTPKTDNSRSSYPPYYDRRSSSPSVEPFSNFKDGDKNGTDETKIKDSSVDLAESSYFKFHNFLSPHSSKLPETHRPSHERSFRHSSSLFPSHSVNIAFKQSKDADRKGTNDIEIKESSVDTTYFKHFTTPISFFYNSPKSSESSEKELSIYPGNGLTQERRSERSQPNVMHAGDVDSICFKPCGRGTSNVALKPSSPTKDGFKLTGPKRLLATPNTAATVNCICSATVSPSPCRRHENTCNRRPSSSVGLCQGPFYTGKDATCYGPRSPTSPQSRHAHFTIPLYDLRSIEAHQEKNLKKPEGSFTLGSLFTENLTKASDKLKGYFTLTKSNESERSEDQDGPPTEKGELQVPQSMLSSAVPEGIRSYSSESWVRQSVPVVSMETANLFSPPKSSREAREAKNWEQRGLSAEQHHVDTLFTRSFARPLSPDDVLRERAKLAMKERKELQKQSQKRDALYFEGNGYMIHSWAENTGNPTRYNVTSVTSPSIECSRSEALIASCKKIICQKRHSCIGESRQTSGKADVGKNRLKKKNLEIKGKHNNIASLDQTLMKGNEKKNHIPVVSKERKAEKRRGLESRGEQIVEKNCLQKSDSLRNGINDKRQKKSRNSTESKVRIQKETETTYDTKLRRTKIAGDSMQEMARHSEIAKMMEKKEKLKEELKQKIKDRLREREAATNPDFRQQKEAADRQQIAEKMSEDRSYYWERKPKEIEERSELSSMPKHLQDNVVKHGAPEKILPESPERNKLARDGRKAKAVPMTELTKTTLLTELGVIEHRENEGNQTQIDPSALLAEDGKKKEPATEPNKNSLFTEFAATEHKETDDKVVTVPSLQQRTQQTDMSAAFPPTLLLFAAPILQNMKMTLMRQIRNVSDQNRTVSFSPPPRRGLYVPLEAYPRWVRI